MSHGHHQPEPVKEKFLTPGVMVMLALMAIGGVFALARFAFGIGYVSNLSNQYPWGLWVAVDVATGVALAAGGFTTGLIAYVFNREQYHAVIRPALLTAMLGYTFVVIGLLVDIGRYWNITSPLFNHNPNSVLFEVAMCVMIYLHVLYIEFLPVIIERFQGRVNLPGFLSRFNEKVDGALATLGRTLDKLMFVFIIAGIVLSCLHQSSLGTLMLIAPSKVHPLWYTPILPLMFLMSAFAAGYPMVTFESLIVAKSFGREPEMDVLTPLARYMPVFMGAYLAVKLGDMIVRGTYVYLLDGTYQSNAFIVEVLVGVVLPFVMLLSAKVRRSPGWLFFASTLYVLGILLNRLNVFIVSYTPPYKIAAYFPSVGEIFITVGLISCLMLLYRVFVFIFPVLGKKPEHMTAAGFILAPLAILLLTTSPALADATGHKISAPEALKGEPLLGQAPPLFTLESKVIKKDSNLYGPVRFMHRKHAQVLKDCTICHHRQPRQEGDTYGLPVTMKKLIQSKQEPVKCSECHGSPFNPKQLQTPGLKGAYHRLCMDCHKESDQTPHQRGPVMYSSMVRGPEVRPLDTRAPTDCLACHAKNTPDHKELVKLAPGADALAVTKNCLSCHEKEGQAILKSAHWKWRGPSPFTQGNEKRNDLGKHFNTINNFCINLNSNWPRCTSCHIGYGWKDANFDFKDMNRIDCLVCHDTTGAYKKAPANAGFPEKGLDLVKVAQNVGRPSRATCGMNCHLVGGGSDGLMQGNAQAHASSLQKADDVHMGAMKRRHELPLPGLPQNQEPPYLRPQHRGGHHRGRPVLRILPHRCAAPRQPANRPPPEQAHQACGLPDLPHTDLRQKPAHQNILGLVHRRQGHKLPAGQIRHAHLRQAEGQLPVGQERQARLPLVQRHREALSPGRPPGQEKAGGAGRAGGRHRRPLGPDIPLQGQPGPPDSRRQAQIPHHAQTVAGLLETFRLEQGRRRGHEGLRPGLQRRI